MKMCDICLNYPCLNNCPNAPEPEAVYLCFGCGEEIRDGDDFYNVCGDPYCEDCVTSAVAEVAE